MKTVWFSLTEASTMFAVWNVRKNDWFRETKYTDGVAIMVFETRKDAESFVCKYWGYSADEVSEDGWADVIPFTLS
jgi:hypothetical protein